MLRWRLGEDDRASRASGETHRPGQHDGHRPLPRHDARVAPAAPPAALDPDAHFERPGVDEYGRELLPSREAVHRTQIADREAEIADLCSVDLDARVGAELPERG